MKNRILSFLAIIAILAGPLLHATAGYTFHFGLPKTESVPLDAYISSILPDEMRASKEYRDELYKMKKVAGIKSPIIVSKALLRENTLADTTNTSFSFLRYSQIRLHENSMARQKAWLNTQTLAHELGHVKKNHCGQTNGLKDISNNSISVALISIACSKTPKQGAFFATLAALASLYANTKLSHETNKTDAQKLEKIQRMELEAEMEAYPLLAKCGYHKAIEANLDDVTTWAQSQTWEIFSLTDWIDSFHSSDFNLTPLANYLNNENIFAKDPEQFEREALALLPKLNPENNEVFSWGNPTSWFGSLYASRTAIMQEQIAYTKHQLIELDEILPQGEKYPSVRKRLGYIAPALAQCRTDVDPRTTQDTPNLMRNGSQPKPNGIAL